jgi:hypothetical protein
MELYREQGDLDRAVLRIEAIYDFIIFGNCIMPIDDINGHAQPRVDFVMKKTNLELIEKNLDIYEAICLRLCRESM